MKKILLINWLYFSKQLIEVDDINWNAETIVISLKGGKKVSPEVFEKISEYFLFEEKKIMTKTLYGRYKILPKNNFEKI